MTRARSYSPSARTPDGRLLRQSTVAPSTALSPGWDELAWYVIILTSLLSLRTNHASHQSCDSGTPRTFDSELRNHTRMRRHPPSEPPSARPAGDEPTLSYTHGARRRLRIPCPSRVQLTRVPSSRFRVCGRPDGTCPGSRTCSYGLLTAFLTSVFPVMLSLYRHLLY